VPVLLEGLQALHDTVAAYTISLGIGTEFWRQFAEINQAGRQYDQQALDG
jgi:hypothetical protein